MHRAKTQKGDAPRQVPSSGPASRRRAAPLLRRAPSGIRIAARRTSTRSRSGPRHGSRGSPGAGVAVPKRLRESERADTGIVWVGLPALGRGDDPFSAPAAGDISCPVGRSCMLLTWIKPQRILLFRRTQGDWDINSCHAQWRRVVGATQVCAQINPQHPDGTQQGAPRRHARSPPPCLLCSSAVRHLRPPNSATSKRVGLDEEATSSAATWLGHPRPGRPQISIGPGFGSVCGADRGWCAVSWRSAGDMTCLHSLASALSAPRLPAYQSRGCSCVWYSNRGLGFLPHPNT